MNRTYFDGTFFVLNKNGNVMATSDIGLLNVKYSFSINTSKCTYKNDHKADLQQPDSNFVNQILEGIKMMIKSNGSQLASDNTITITTSALANQGIDELKSLIHNWVAKNGKRLKF